MHKNKSRNTKKTDQSSSKNTAHSPKTGARALSTFGSMLENTPLSRQVIDNQSLLAMQVTQGNAFVGQFLGQQSQAHVAREVDYNATGDAPDEADPEQATGVLPFNEEGGWDGLAIGRRVSQLNTATPHFDESRCVEASFLVALIQRGPDAVKDMINNYLDRYRGGLRRVSVADNIKRWYRHSIRVLSPLVDKIDNQTLTFTDLAIIMQEMYNVYGEGDFGTRWVVGNNMARREGYEVEVVDQDIYNREDVAPMAQALQPGELLSCRVNATSEGTDDYNHAIHIGRHPQTNDLYLYDPFPVRGDQLVVCSDDLTEINHYFESEVEFTDEATGETEMLEDVRTFNVYAKLTPPTEEAAPDE